MAIPDFQHVLDLLRRGDAAEAVPLLEHRAERVPAHVTTRVLLALAYEAGGRWDDALAAWQAAHLLMPNSPVVAEGRRRVFAALAPPPAAFETGVEETAVLPADDVGAEPEAADALVETPEGGPEEAAPPEIPSTSAGETAPPELPPEEDGRPPSFPQPELPTLARLEEEFGAADVSPEDVEEDPAPTSKRLGWETLKSTASEEEDFWGEDPTDEAEVAPPAGDEFDDLDRLIEELESARIVPGPDFDAIPAPDLEDEIEDIVSETLARIYAAQQQFDEAARVYELLAAQHPERSGEYLQKAAEMRSRATDE